MTWFICLSIEIIFRNFFLLIIISLNEQITHSIRTKILIDLSERNKWMWNLIVQQLTFTFDLLIDWYICLSVSFQFYFKLLRLNAFWKKNKNLKKQTNILKTSFNYIQYFIHIQTHICICIYCIHTHTHTYNNM